jgi:hypothetical protein
MWPTWADLLSVEFDYYENWGQTGLGNRAIAERLVECHTKNNITKNDVVVIQWSTHLRHDWHHESSFMRLRPGWQTSGNVFQGLNKFTYDQKWIERFFCERSWFMHTLNFVMMAKTVLEQIGCEYRMTSIGDLRNLGNDFDKLTYDYEKTITEKTKDNTNNIFEAWVRFPELQFYEEKIWDEQWIEPLNVFAQKNSEYFWWFQASHDKDPWYESHPSPKQHQLWLNQHLLPSLGMTVASKKQQEIVDICKELKSKEEYMDVLKFENYLMNNPAFDDIISWPPERLGL